MITDEKLLRPYVEGQDLPFERSALKGVSTYLIGHGEGVFYRLKDGRILTPEGKRITLP